jgi:hypothetical protein
MNEKTREGQKKVRAVLEIELAKCKKGERELIKSINLKKRQLDKIRGRINNIKEELKEDDPNFTISDHAYVQYIRRLRPDLFEQITDEIKTGKGIEKRVSNNVIKTIVPKK